MKNFEHCLKNFKYGKTRYFFLWEKKNKRKKGVGNGGREEENKGGVLNRNNFSIYLNHYFFCLFLFWIKVLFHPEDTWVIMSTYKATYHHNTWIKVVKFKNKSTNLKITVDTLNKILSKIVKFSAQKMSMEKI